MDLAPGLVVADRFRLERVLGEGGMGAVWLARHTALDVPCAVKFIHPEAARSAEVRGRFEREAKAAAQLRSPHVVQILDHGVWEGAPYIAMELLDGEDLDHRLTLRGRLSPPETMAVALHVGRALTKAHAAGLVHRDLKPANIFLVKDDEREIAKVLDFGIAKTTAVGVDGTTKTGAVLGTPYYMSPEQARGQKGIDHRADLWSLGVVVYQCVVGELPFVSDTLGDLLAKIMFEPLPVPSSHAQVPPGFDAWWARAAARDPALRFQSAKELTDALGLAIGVTVPFAGDVGAHMGPQRDSAPEPPKPGGTVPFAQSGSTPAPTQGAAAMAAPPGPPASLAASTPSAAQALHATGAPPPATPQPYSTSMAAAVPTPAKSRAPLALAVVAVVALGGLGLYAFLRITNAPVPTAHSAAPVSAPAPPSAAPEAPSQAPSSSAPASAAAPPPASASAPSPRAGPAPRPPSASHPTPPTHPAARRKDDFGI